MTLSFIEWITLVMLLGWLFVCAVLLVQAWRVTRARRNVRSDVRVIRPTNSSERNLS